MTYLLLIILALDERLQAGSPAVVRIATMLGLASALLFFAVGGLRFTSYPQLSSLYSQDPGAVGAAYLGYLMVDSGLDRAAIFASGWWLLLMNWVALPLREWSKALSYLGLLVGMGGILGGAMPSLAPIALLLYIVWFLWLGITLVRAPIVVARPSAARP